jgi:hypothetical protein
MPNTFFPSLEELAAKAMAKAIATGELSRSSRYYLKDVTREAVDRELALTICTAIEAKEEIYCTDIERALHHAAFARKEDIELVLQMVKENPCLMHKAGNVLTPGGLLVKRVTLYEFFLGAGDPEAAKLVRDCFFESIEESKNRLPANKVLDVEQAAKELDIQYERYRPHIEGMLTQEPYDLKPLIEIIKQASREDVIALLEHPLLLQNEDGTFKSKLHEAMSHFRNDWAPSVLDKPSMHYNHNSLKHAFEILASEWDNLLRADENAYNKILLVCRQIIGFEELNLPGVDRCAVAQGLHYLIHEDEAFRRSDEFYGGSLFPARLSRDSLVDLGLNSWVDVYCGMRGRYISAARPGFGLAGGCGFAIGDLMSSKNNRLTKLAMQSTQTQTPSA